jgi:hypothetical protein
MEKFRADGFFEISRLLQSFYSVSYPKPEILIGEDAKLVTEWLPDLQNNCALIGLRLSAKYISKEIENLKAGKTSVADWQKTIPELQHRIRDEMEDKLFMYIPPERADRYDQPQIFGKDVHSRFPAIQYDATEAGNCYACGRSTAVVFHLMRIMEIGVQQLAARLQVGLPSSKNWQNLLDELNKAIKALDQKAPETKEFAAASANLYSVKLAWRNEVMHPNDTYTLEEADNLLRQTKIFMIQLAKVV